MKPLNSEQIEQVWKNLVYSPKQVNNFSLDLTLKSIYAFVDIGQVDFGGGEYKGAKIKQILPKSEDDPKYGWWNLEKGNYLAEYNEILIDPHYMALISSHERILRTGTFHPTLLWLPKGDEEPIYMTIQVGENGIRVKENSRISTTITFKAA